VYGNGSRTRRAKNRGVCYPTKISHFKALINEEEDCLREVIDFAHSKGVKVAFYMPYTKFFKNIKGVSFPELEQALSKELIEKYKPDGLAYEAPTSNEIWKDIKKIDPDIELFLYTAHVSPEGIEKKSQGNWNCITMDNLDYPDEIYPPIVCLYASDQKVMDPIKFNNQLLRMLNTPGVKGYYLYLLSPSTLVEPYASVIGELYHGLYSKSRRWLPEKTDAANAKNDQ
jgi:hypothetical protein